MTDETSLITAKRKKLASHIWSGQIALIASAVVILLIIGAHALGIVGWVAPILLIGVAFYALHSLMVMDWRGTAIAAGVGIMLVIATVVTGG